MHISFRGQIAARVFVKTIQAPICPLNEMRTRVPRWKVLLCLRELVFDQLASELYLLDAPPAGPRRRLDYVSATLLAELGGSAKDASYRQGRNRLRLQPSSGDFPPSRTAQHLRSERNSLLALAKNI